MVSGMEALIQIQIQIMHQTGYLYNSCANNLSDAPYLHSRSVYCHHSLVSLQRGRQPIKVPNLYHVIPCHHFKL